MNYVVTIQQRVAVKAEDEGKAREAAENSPPFRWAFERDWSLKTVPAVKVVEVRRE